MKIVKATVVYTETHHIEIEVPDDTSNDDCEKMMWDEYSKHTPNHFESELVDFEVSGVIK